MLMAEDGVLVGGEGHETVNSEESVVVRSGVDLLAATQCATTGGRCAIGSGLTDADACDAATALAGAVGPRRA